MVIHLVIVRDDLDMHSHEANFLQIFCWCCIIKSTQLLDP